MIEDSFRRVGGCAVNVAVTLKNLGLVPHIVSGIGGDERGDCGLFAGAGVVHGGDPGAPGGKDRVLFDVGGRWRGADVFDLKRV